MKKIFLAFVAVALLASCSEEMGLAPTFGEFKDLQITMSAYTGTSVSRGSVITGPDFLKEGIGVFAFYQPSVNGIAPARFTTVKYPTPNFMYNQLVSADATGNWTYSPIKYWPNNPGDQLSFFAYAPYDPDATWEDLGIKSNATGTTLSKTFVIFNEVDDQSDYLFADPTNTINKTKPSSITENARGTGSADASGNAEPDIIMFNFQHILSKINLYVGVNVDVNTASSGSAIPNGSSAAANWTDKNTTIEIKSIEFKDLAETYTWTKTGAGVEWKADGKQNIKVIPSDMDGANLVTCDASADPEKTWETGRWHRVLEGSGDATASSDAYMFIAPQTKSDIENNEIVITYVVKTTDPTGNILNDSEITNVITKKWGDFKNVAIATNGLESGKQYKLYFLIGMQTVKIAADVTDWQSGTEHVLDTPAADEVLDFE